MKRFFTLFVAVLAWAAMSCSDKDDAVNVDAPRPSFGEMESSEESASGVWLYAEYTYEGAEEVTGAGFAYKLRRSQDAYVSVPADSWDRKSMQLQLTDLQPDTEYMYYGYVEVSGARYNSPAQIFTTAPEGTQAEPEPHFSTPEVASCTQTGAVLSCSYTYQGEAAPAGAGFRYRAENADQWTSVEAGSTDSPLHCEVDGLQAATTYLFYAFVTVGEKEYRSGEERFTTLEEEAQAPVFVRPSCTEVTATTATVSGSFTYEGSATVSEVGFRYKPASSSTYSKVTVTATVGDASAELSGLTPSTTYSVMLYAVIGGTDYQSEATTFTTSAQSSGGGSAAKFSGWPELLAEDDSNSDYYYAYHLCPDLKTSRGDKARNYTVCFSAEHHCPVWVAAPRHESYEGSSGRTEAYKADPDIPADIQYYSKSTGGGCNKGHMLGSAERTCTSSVNRQVFYYSNIAPQYSSGFNTGDGGWNILEYWIDTKVCADTTYLVIGTYFEKYTDRYGNSASPKKISFGSRNDVSCPTMFYIAVLRTKSGNTKKSVVECSADELMCAVFVRCHNNNLKGKAVSAKDMISVRELEQLTGFDYFPNVPNAPKDSYNPSDWGL